MELLGNSEHTSSVLMLMLVGNGLLSSVAAGTELEKLMSGSEQSSTGSILPTLLLITVPPPHTFLPPSPAQESCSHLPHHLYKLRISKLLSPGGIHLRIPKEGTYVKLLVF